MLHLLLLLFAQAPEVLSPPEVTTIRRLDGSVVECVAQKVVEGPEARLGKWVVLGPAVTDPYGFGPLLNAYRASKGLAALRYDAGLSKSAAANDAVQQVKGLGHWVRASWSSWQVAAWNFPTTQAVLLGWEQSPPHDAALLARVTTYGIDWSAPYWTANLR